jgi:hypothetical protein
MVGYQAHLLTDLDAGLGVISLTNSPYDPKRFAMQAWELLCAYQSAGRVQETQPRDPMVVPNGADYIGRYLCGEKEFSLTLKGDHLVLEFKGEPVLMEPAGPDAFIVPHPSFGLYLLRFGRQSLSNENEETPVSEAYYGPDWYTREGFQRPEVPAYPETWNAYPGHYRSHNPWLTNFRVILRKGTMFLVYPLGDEELLYPVDANVFRVGTAPRSPEFIRFDLILDGKAMRANLSGGDYSRTFTP